jgi:hypothetical protein
VTPDPPDSLSVEANLDVTIEGQRCAVWTEGDRLVVNAPSLSTGRDMLAGVEAVPVPQPRLVGGLADTALTVEVRVRHAPVARLGAGVEPSRLATLAAHEADLSPRGVLVAGWRWLG